MAPSSIYTSGTTGPPKGVRLTHANILAELDALSTVYDYEPGDSLVSFLPHAHIADRALCSYAGFVVPLELTLCPDPWEVLLDVLDRRPTLFGAVPRVWEKLKAALEAGGVDPTHLDGAGRTAVRHQIGFDHVRLAMSGAAPIAREVLDFFGALGVPSARCGGYNVALVVLDPDAAPAWTGDREAEVAAAVERANAKLSRVEQIKRFCLVAEDWQPGGDELTPTMKLKRKPIAAKYAEQLEALYA